MNKGAEMYHGSRLFISKTEFERERPTLHPQPPLFLRHHTPSGMSESCHTGMPGGEIEQLLAQFQTSFIKPCAAWAAAGGVPDAAYSTIFYPFGGPDILFPLALFPHARKLVLVGREPCGLQSDFSMEKVTKAIQHYLRSSFFITEDLKQDLSTADLNGLLPLILVQLHWAGYTLLSVDDIASGIGFRIRFFGAEGERLIQYFRQDLRDGYFVQESPLFRNIVDSEKCITLLKSASYLLHEPYFSMLRQLIKEQSRLLLQDPSGLPYSLLCEWGWDLNLHGHFTSDIPPFARKYDQSMLRMAYEKKASCTPLSFGFGYLEYPESAAIMVAISPQNRA